ncbi:MAG: adenylate/guanylate cyclase domain-containing protein, partial [Pseudomonadota bacterium]
LAETLEPDEYFSLLNSYFDATAEPVQEFGGEVLDFIGDAVLGIFPFENDTELKSAVCAANNALSRTIQKANENNELRAKEGLERFNYGVALNAGDVMFGNIGIPSRLTFSAIGPTVNEAARIEQMTKLLQRTALAGKDIAQIAPDNWTSVGSHKLEGMLDPVELFAFTGT